MSSFAAIVAAGTLEAAKRADKLCMLHVPSWRRKASLVGASMACDEMLSCEYHIELGFPKASEYSRARFGRGRRHLVRGLAAVVRLRDELPHFRRLWSAGVLNPRKLAACAHLINPSTAWYWFPLLIHLTPRELRKTAVAQKAARRGVVGGAVFVPMWIPDLWYKRYWAPRDTGEPAFTIMQAMLKEAGSD